MSVFAKIFNAMASLLDEGVANVTAALARTGLWNNTLLLFTADNYPYILFASYHCEEIAWHMNQVLD